MTLITVGAVAVGLVLVVALVVMQGLAGPGVDSSGLREPTSEAPLALADGRALGRADAPVTMEVWSDFQCPACRTFATQVEPQLIRRYVTPGTLRIVHRDAAFQGQRAGRAYDESVEAAAGARCAAEQGLYWPMHDWLFANQGGENQGAYADARLRGMALEAGVEIEAWDACRATGTEQAAVRAETTAGLGREINATPTLIIGDQVIVGVRTADELGQIIEAAAQ
jgi:protein-disulfide isomerase